MANFIRPRSISEKDSRAYDDKLINYQLFPEDYFSGCDVNVYFGDVWVDEIVSIQFAMQEQVLPIYGYNSYTYDAIARGNRIIQGSFRINFKESLYLKMVANEATYDRAHDTNKNKVPFLYTQTPLENTIEATINKTRNSSKAEFEKLADNYERALWGVADTTKESIARLSNDSDPYFRPNHSGFSVMITFGPTAERYKYNNVFADETTVTITGVELTSVSQVIQPSGETIFEEYGFLAKDLNAKSRK